jgi:hypothetical protein
MNTHSWSNPHKKTRSLASPPTPRKGERGSVTLSREWRLTHEQPGTRRNLVVHPVARGFVRSGERRLQVEQLPGLGRFAHQTLTSTDGHDGVAVRADRHDLVDIGLPHRGTRGNAAEVIVLQGRLETSQRPRGHDVVGHERNQNGGANGECDEQFPATRHRLPLPVLFRLIVRYVEHPEG